MPKLYKGQQEEGNKTLITALIKAERVIRGRQVAQVKQTTGASPGTFIPHNRDYLAISKPARATTANPFDRVYLTVFMRSIRSIN